MNRSKALTRATAFGNSMRTQAKLIAPAAVLLLVALAGCQSATTPTATAAPPATSAPTPSAALLASGTFKFAPMHTTVEIDASGEGSDVAGTMTVKDAASSLTVDLECTLTTEDGRIAIGGDIAESTFDDMPKDTRYAVIFTPGSPLQAIFSWQGTDQARAPSCVAFLENESREAGGAPIDGTVEFGP